LSRSAETDQWSQSIAAQVVRAAPLIAAIRLASGAGLTGLLWRHDLVVTADSSLPAQEAYAVALANGHTLAARSLRRDSGLGIAALGLVGTGPTAPIELAAPPAVGAVLLALVAGADATPTGRLTVVHSLHSEGGSSPLRIVLDAAPGFIPEGGPVFDDRGALVGLCAGSPDQPPCVVPHTAIVEFLGDEPAGTLMRRGWIGAALQPVTVAAPLRRIVGQATGRLVISLTPNGPADEAGILPGDILLAVDGQRMNGPGRLRSLLGPERIGRAVNVRLVRQGQIRTRRLTVAGQPAT
jgi:S1-C subfamily serine protease